MPYKKLTLSVLVPTYNGAKTIKDTLLSILSQSFKNYRLIIHDDASTDETIKIVKSLKDKRIRIFRNKKNLGCQKNMERARRRMKSDILFFMAQDDILAKDALLKTYDAFKTSEEIGFVTRPYFWFEQNINVPVRITSEVNPIKNEVISLRSNYNKIEKVIESIGQISGLAYRTKYFNLPFHEDIFTGHAYLFASILKHRKAIFLKDLTVAVRIQTSQSRKLSHIYDKSPLQSWVDFFNTIFYEKKFSKLRQYFISNYAAKNYIGLLQIRNYSKFSYVLREIFLLLKYRWQNIYNPSFFMISMLCIVAPPRILTRFVDWYKRTINTRFIRPISFKYEL